MSNTQVGTQNSSNSTQRTVIDEVLDGGQARDVLARLVDAQVQNNKIRSLRCQVHNECPDETAEQQTRQLRTFCNEARANCNEAQRAGQPVHVRVTVEYCVGDMDGDVPAEADSRPRMHG